MITKVTDVNALSGVDSPLFPLIYSDFRYPSSESDGVYEHIEYGKRQCIISVKNGTAVIVKTGENFNSDELFAFFSFWSISDILADFKLKNTQKAYPLFSAASCENISIDTCFLSPKSRFSDYEKLYSLLSEYGENFSEWFSVFSRKINNGDALCSYITAENKIKSACVVNSIYANSAVISGVATHSGYRKKGCASMCIKAMLNKLHVRGVQNVYLWCETNNTDFYKNIGFKQIGEIYT